MSTEATGERVREEGVIQIDLPQDRQYSDPADVELDRALSAAIEAADEAGDDYLAQLLSFELGSHYYDNRDD